MITYITPTVYRYENVDKLLANNPSSTSLEQPQLSIDDLLEERFLCVVGDPGIGKSRLFEEFISSIKEKSRIFSCKAFEFDEKQISGHIDYCIIDALDEVDNKFNDTLKAINDFKRSHKSTKVLFSCRKHYVTTYVSHFASCQELCYLELQRLSMDVVWDVFKNCSINAIEKIKKKSKILQLLTIPRYLIFFLEYEEQKGDCGSIGELFDFIIRRSIDKAIENYDKNTNRHESLGIVIQRMLEKIAFVMEIARKDHITKDELYTILDGLKGNMSQMIIANFDLLYLENRILKNDRGNLQFENTELQEYLAAKELCRQDNIESVIYDVAVQSELKHIYPNWFDVIPHISYLENDPDIFINIVKLIISYEANLANEAFDSLFRYINSSLFSIQQQKELFSIIFNNYQCNPVYIYWNNEILNLLKDCYSPNCDALLKIPYEKFSEIQLSNISAILERIIEKRNVSVEVREYWIEAANELIRSNDFSKQRVALNLYKALKDTEDLIRISSLYYSFCDSVKEMYYDVTGYGKVVNSDVINCWLDGCYKCNPHAINAILYIEDSNAIVHIYNKIVEDEKCHELFSPKGSLIVYYELYLKRQFDIVWKNNPDNRLLMVKIIATYLKRDSYYTHNVFDTIVKQILLCEDTGTFFIEHFENKWEIESILRYFAPELIDFELISALDKILSKSDMEECNKNNCLIALVNKIRNVPDKKKSISECIERYSKTSEQRDKNTLKEMNKKHDDVTLDSEYNSLIKKEIPENTKYECAFNLCKRDEYLQNKSKVPVVYTIIKFFNALNLDALILNRIGQNSYTLSKALTYIPCYVKFLYGLGFYKFITKNRLLLAKTLPVINCGANLDTHEIRAIYKSIIGKISEEEKKELIKWWKSREDDFMNMGYEDIISCISAYDMDALSYKLEEYVDEYIKNQDIGHALPASKALEVISKGHCQWNVERFRSVFEALNNDDVESIRMQCNGIMIEKFEDKDAITWRIDYLKNNVVKSFHNETGHMRALSHIEAEMISPNPRMFRCFMLLKNNQYLIDEMINLFDWGLPLCMGLDTQEYSRYLLNQIYNYFINVGKLSYIKELRNRVEKNEEQKINWLAYDIMNNAEKAFLQNNERTIDKSIKLYNKCIEENYLPIRNEDDLRRYFIQIIHEVDIEIQDGGIYSIVRQENLNEDFIQRELKNTIINKCCQMGLTNVRIDREVAQQDNKRTDLLFRYGLCNPVMIEVKLLHNKDVQEQKIRREYKKLFVKYSKEPKACLSVFWVFDIKRSGSNFENFTALKKEYEDLEHTLVWYTDCRCSSGIDTGISKKRKKLNKSKLKDNNLIGQKEPVA